MKSLAPILAVIVSACTPGCVLHGAAPARDPSRPADPTSLSRRVADAASSSSSPEEVSPVPVDASDPSWGSSTAPVTIVEFSDFQCLYCGAVQTTLQELRKIYGKDKLRIVWKDQPLPFHAQARSAAEAARAVFSLAGNEAFWRFHDLLFSNQELLEPERYEAWAQESGAADRARLRQAFESHAGASSVQKNMDLANTLGARATPSFFINGVALIGAQPIEAFREVVDGELVKARAAIASGTPPARVYAVLSRQNMPSPVQGDAAKTTEPGDSRKDDKTVWAVPITGAPTRGPATALVTIVMFSDYQCPFCKLAEETLDRIRTTYGQDVRVVFRNNPLPFHDHAEAAAELAVFAWKTKGEEAFWATHDRLFGRQENLEDATLEAIARELKLDAVRAMRAVAKHSYRSIIEEEIDLADDLEVHGTPHFFINGRRLSGSQPFEKFQAMIDEERAHARALLDEGTSAVDLYAEIMRNGRSPKPPEKADIPLPPPNVKIPSRGGAQAKVVIQEFSDFQCPFCAQVQKTLADVMSAYGDRIKIVFRNRLVPGHADAPLAAEAAAEAFHQKGSAGFWKMHDLLFAHQGEDGGLQAKALEDYARRVGLDLPAFRTALTNHLHQDAVRSDDQVAEAAGIDGTPSFVINGYVVRGAQPFAKFRKIVARALSEAH